MIHDRVELHNVAEIRYEATGPSRVTELVRDGQHSVG